MMRSSAAWPRRRRALCGRAPGGDAARPCSACWCRRRRWWSRCSAASGAVGAGDRLDGAGAARRGAARRARARAARHPGRGLRHRDHRHHAVAPDGVYWRGPRPLAARTRGALAPRRPPRDAPTDVAPLAPGAGRTERTSWCSTGCRALSAASRRSTRSSLDGAREGAIHGIIGPNGAGKTTLFNVSTGCSRARRRHHHLRRRQPAGLRPSGVCRLGIGRTFQVVRAFPRMTRVWRTSSSAPSCARQGREAARADALRGLARRRAGRAQAEPARRASSPTTQLRLMELARALSPEPRLLLLDETLRRARRSTEVETFWT